MVLARDKVPGRIWYDEKEKVRKIVYTPSAFDRGNMMQGMLGLAKILYVGSATEIIPSIAGVGTWIRPTSGGKSDWADDDSFTAFLEKLEKSGNDLDRASYGSAHQMGTCRMGSSPANSVVNARGGVWGVGNLYVSDASVFPTSTGVNPMITTLSFGEWIGRRMVEDMVADIKSDRSRRPKL